MCKRNFKEGLLGQGVIIWVSPSAKSLSVFCEE